MLLHCFISSCSPVCRFLFLSLKLSRCFPSFLSPVSAEDYVTIDGIFIFSSQFSLIIISSFPPFFSSAPSGVRKQLADGEVSRRSLRGAGGGKKCRAGRQSPLRVGASVGLSESLYTHPHVNPSANLSLLSIIPSSL